MNGLLAIDKPKGITSFDVIRDLKRSLRGRKFKIGHGGTLDPFATGVLTIFFGDALKFVQYFLHSDKTYEGTIQWGEATASGDHTNPVVERTEVIPQDLEELQKVAREFVEAPYLQVPPMHSAIKREGVPLYELARRGESVDREPVERFIYRFEILSLNQRQSKFRAEVSSGTYLRVLSEDLAKRMGSLAHLVDLRRVKAGAMEISQTTALSQACAYLEAGDPIEKLSGWIPFDRVPTMLGSIPVLEVEREDAMALIHGQPQVLSRLGAKAPKEKALLGVSYRGIWVGVLRHEKGIWKSDRVLITNLP